MGYNIRKKYFVREDSYHHGLITCPEHNNLSTQHICRIDSVETPRPNTKRRGSTKTSTKTVDRSKVEVEDGGVKEPTSSFYAVIFNILMDQLVPNQMMTSI